MMPGPQRRQASAQGQNGRGDNHDNHEARWWILGLLQDQDQPRRPKTQCRANLETARVDHTSEIERHRSGGEEHAHGQEPITRPNADRHDRQADEHRIRRALARRMKMIPDGEVMTRVGSPAMA